MKLSIIIPALNEEKYIERCLQSVVAQDTSPRDYEVIVVDGGSTDKTREIARKYTDMVLAADKRGIGYQQNLGASAASGDLLLFIHADTYFIRRDVFKGVVRYFEDDAVAGGAVSHKYHPENKFRIKIFNTVDSLLASFFVYLDKPGTGGPVTIVRKGVFNEIGGFIENICEDAEIGRRLKEKGKVFRDTEVCAYSSSRRLEKEGILWNTLKYALTKAALRLGMALNVNYPVVR